MDREHELKDLPAWQALGKLLGWRVMGWTFDRSCLFDRGDGTTVTMDKTTADAIRAALA